MWSVNSSQWEEVFGWMIAEAMAHAKPVVATRVGGIPELIIDGVSGYLVTRGDTELMSERVLDLLQGSLEARAPHGPDRPRNRANKIRSAKERHAIDRVIWNQTVSRPTH